MACAVSIEAWSTANCCDVATFVVVPADSDVDVEVPAPVPLEEDLAAPPDEVSAEPLEVVLVRPVPEDEPLEPPEGAPLDEPLPEPDDNPRAELRALSSWLTFLMSAETSDWAEEAWLRAAAQVVGVPDPPEVGVVVGGPGVVVGGPGVVVGGPGVVVGGPLWIADTLVSHNVVATFRPAAAWDESASSCLWPATSAACSWVTCWLICVDLSEPDDGTVVVVVELVEPDEEFVDVLEDAVWLASAPASVAVADARVAWAEITVALRSAMSSDANVWPAVTVWPTETSTALIVPETLKFRFA